MLNLPEILCSFSQIWIHFKGPIAILVMFFILLGLTRAYT